MNTGVIGASSFFPNRGTSIFSSLFKAVLLSSMLAPNSSNSYSAYWNSFGQLRRTIPVHDSGILRLANGKRVHCKSLIVRSLIVVVGQSATVYFGRPWLVVRHVPRSIWSRTPNSLSKRKTGSLTLDFAELVAKTLLYFCSSLSSTAGCSNEVEEVLMTAWTSRMWAQSSWICWSHSHP